MHERASDQGPPSPAAEVGEIDDKILCNEAYGFQVVVSFGLFLGPLLVAKDSAAECYCCPCDYLPVVLPPIGQPRGSVCRPLLKHG